MAVDGNEHDPLSLLSQSIGPVAQSLDGESELGEAGLVADDDRTVDASSARRQRQQFVLAAVIERQNRDEGWFQHAWNDTDAGAEESFRTSGSFLVEFFRMPEGAARVYRFGPYVLDVDDRSLKRHGAPIPLTPKTFDLLVVLVENAGRLVEKDLLLRTVWPDVAVEEGNLTKGVFSLRQTLEQEGSPRYIETVPKRGYRFAAAVIADADHSPAVASPPPAGAAPVPQHNSIAVMPFSDMSAARDQEFFCEGMSEEIINALGRVPDLRVASYTSSLRFKENVTDTQTIGRELMVAWLLEGSVRKAGEMVRIAVQLVRAADGFSSWSGRFDRKLDDIFTVQDDIAETIAQTLTERVGKSAAPLVTSKTSSTDAYSLYLEGRYLWNKRPGDVVWQAIDRFERSIAIDPAFAPAHAALASVYGTLGAWEFGVLPPAEALAKAKAAARRALELDPQLAAGHTAIGYTTLHFDWNADRACREFDQAIALNPAWVDAHHWHSHALCAASRFTESLVACRRIVELDPVNPLMHAHVAWHHYMARDYAEALAQAERVVRMEPSFHWGHFFAGWALERLGREAEAVDRLQQAAVYSSDNPVMIAGLGQALAANQDAREALRIVRTLERLRGDKGLFAYEIGLIHATLGDSDTAFGWLARAVQERSGWIAYLKVDPRLASLRPDPRFPGLLPAATH